MIVPSRAVGNRLSRGYASGSGEGISAGFNFELPGEWLTPFLGAQVGSLAQTPELEWLVWNRLLEDDFLNDPRSENVRHYLTDPSRGTRERRMTPPAWNSRSGCPPRSRNTRRTALTGFTAG